MCDVVCDCTYMASVASGRVIICVCIGWSTVCESEDVLMMLMNVSCS